MCISRDLQPFPLLKTCIPSTLEYVSKLYVKVTQEIIEEHITSSDIGMGWGRPIFYLVIRFTMDFYLHFKSGHACDKIVFI